MLETYPTFSNKGGQYFKRYFGPYQRDVGSRPKIEGSCFGSVVLAWQEFEEGGEGI